MATLVVGLPTEIVKDDNESNRNQGNQDWKKGNHISKYNPRIIRRQIK